jgi:hypothetical protein
MLLIHAINPHGFAWQRRVNEENVDLNRNFVGHGGGYPANEGYEQLRDSICPREWTPESRAAADKALYAYRDQHGAMALQGAIMSGQYIHADGVFYGGRAAGREGPGDDPDRFGAAGGGLHRLIPAQAHGYGEIISNHRPTGRLARGATGMAAR